MEDYNKYLPVPFETVNCFEVWWPVKDYEGIYEVSNLGRVKSLNYKRTGKERILKPQKDRYGYFTVNLSKNGKVKRHSLHRLVCDAFNRLPENYHADHRNWIRTDNRSLNLRPLAADENSGMVSFGGKEKRRNAVIKSCSKTVYQYNMQGNQISVWKSAKEAARRLGYEQGNISKCCRGESKQAYGFIWSTNELDNGTLAKKIYDARQCFKKTVLQYDIDGNFIREWDSTMDIHRELGFDHSAISKCCLGKIRTVRGYVWKYQ